MAQTTSGAAALATATASLAGGPLAVVFGEMAAVQAIMGLGGGAAMAVSTRESAWSTVTAGLLGAVLAVGLGVLGESVLSAIMGLKAGENVSGPQAVAAYSFAIGLAQRPIYEWFARRTGGSSEDGDKT